MIVYTILLKPGSTLYIQGMVWAPSIKEPFGGIYRDFIWSFVPKDAISPWIVFGEESRETQIKHGVVDRTILISDDQIASFDKIGPSAAMKDYRKYDKIACELGRKEELRLKELEAIRLEAEKIRKEKEEAEKENERVKQIERQRLEAEPHPRALISLIGAIETSPFKDLSKKPYEAETILIRYFAFDEYIRTVAPKTMNIEDANKLWQKIRNAFLEKHEPQTRFHQDLIFQIHGSAKERAEADRLAYDYLSSLVADELIAGGFSIPQATNYVCLRRETATLAMRKELYSPALHIAKLGHDYLKLYPQLTQSEVSSPEELNKILQEKAALIHNIFMAYGGHVLCINLF